MLATKTKTGQRDRRITILEKEVTTNAFNEEVVTEWATFATVWAKVIDDQSRRGNEGYESDQLTEDKNTVFDIRYLSGVTVEMRILHDDRYYDIISKTEPDRKRTLYLKARILDET